MNPKTRQRLRRTLQLTAFGTILILLAGWGEHLRGKALVEATKAKLEEAGIHLGLAENCPANTGTNGRLAAALTNIVVSLPDLHDHDSDSPLPPAMQSLGEGFARVSWREENLHVNGRFGKRVYTNLWESLHSLIEPNRDKLRELGAATGTPGNSSLVDWTTGPHYFDNPKHALIRASQWLLTAASCDMREKNYTEAHQHLLANIRLAGIWNDAPSTIYQLYLLPTIDIAFRSQWELLHYDGWTDRQVAAWQTEWEMVNVLKSLPSEFQWGHTIAWSELQPYRSKITKAPELFWELNPSTNTILPNLIIEDPIVAAAATINTVMWPLWLSYHDEAKSLGLLQESVSIMHRLQETSSLQSAQANLTKLNAQYSNVPVYYLGAEHTLGPYVSFYVKKKFEHQTLASMAATAIALKRYTLRFGDAPDDLNQLPSDIRPQRMTDYMCGRPLRYVRTGNGRFKLWSVGTDFIDGNGDTTPTRTRYRHAVRDSADWVWPRAGTPEQLHTHQISIGLTNP